MSTLVAAGALAGLVALSLAVSRTNMAERAPRLGATVELLALAAIGLAPPVLLVCGAGAWADALGFSARAPAALCLAASGSPRPVQLALYALAGLLVVRVGAFALRAARASRRAELRGVGLERAVPFVLRSGEVAYVVPSDRLLAYAGGLRRPKAVATTGLLALLDPIEQEAVVRHEVAHLRLGHPRVAVLGAAIARAYWWLPPARTAWVRLRRELEAAADDEVAAEIGPEPLLRALAKVALAQAGARGEPQAGRRAGLAEAFADPEDLRYRIRRLQAPRSPRGRAAVVLGVLGTLLLAGLASTLCAALHAGVGWTTITPCVVAFGAVGGRPAWGRRLRGAPRPAPGS